MSIHENSKQIKKTRRNSNGNRAKSNDVQQSGIKVSNRCCVSKIKEKT